MITFTCLKHISIVHGLCSVFAVCGYRCFTVLRKSSCIISALCLYRSAIVHGHLKHSLCTWQTSKRHIQSTNSNRHGNEETQNNSWNNNTTTDQICPCLVFWKCSDVWSNTDCLKSRCKGEHHEHMMYLMNINSSICIVAYVYVFPDSFRHPVGGTPRRRAYWNPSHGWFARLRWTPTGNAASTSSRAKLMNKLKKTGSVAKTSESTTTVVLVKIIPYVWRVLGDSVVLCPYSSTNLQQCFLSWGLTVAV